MRSPIHPEGFFLAGFLALGALLIRRFSRIASCLLAAFATFTVLFFRDPERLIPDEPDAIVSPADGKIVGIDHVDDVPFIDGAATRISVFLSIFNVHINRSPISGKITYRHYNPGKFLPAFAPKASLENEQNSIGIDDNGYRILVRQIAGIVARRIICWKNPGDALAKGDRFGLIRFGSRTDIFLPPETKITVKIGDSVKGGSTIIARRP